MWVFGELVIYFASSEICYFLHNEVKGFSAGQCFPYPHKEIA